MWTPRAGERIQVSGERGDERFAFAGFHLGDLALVQHHAADQLHIEMAHGQRAAAGLARQGKRRGDRGLEGIGQALLIVGFGRIGARQGVRPLGL